MSRPLSVESPAPRHGVHEAEANFQACAGSCGECPVQSPEADAGAAGTGGARHALIAGLVFVLPVALALLAALAASTPLRQLLCGLAGLAVGVALARPLSRALARGSSEEE